MSDLIQRLRNRKAFFQNGGVWLMSCEPDPDCQLAATEIYRLQGIANQGIHNECELRIEIERLRRVLQGIADNDGDRWPGQAAVRALKAEVERLRELLRGVGANRYWEGRYRDAIEECARVAESHDAHEGWGDVDTIAAAIRALKEKP